MNGWRDEYWPLVECAVDEPPSAELAAQFEQTLSADERARRVFLDHIQLQAEIHLLVCSRRTLDKTLEQLDQLRAAPRQRTARLPAFVASGLNSLAQPLHFGLFFAAVTMISLGLFFAQIKISEDEAGVAEARPSAPDRLIVARLSQQREAQWEAGAVAPAAGNALRLGEELALQHGWVEVRLNSGVRLILEGPARFTLSESNGGFLARGMLMAEVPKAARGFTVRAAQGTVVDLGTEFGVVADARHFQTTVFSGRVEVQVPGQVGAAHSLSTGESWEVLGAIARSLPEAPLELQRLREQRAAFAAARPLRFRLTSLPPGSGEESLVAQGRFEAGLNIGQEAPAMVVNGLHFADARTAASQVGVTLACNAIEVGGRLEKDLPSGSWKGQLATLMSSGAGTPIGGACDLTVGGLTVGQEYSARFYCAHAIGVRGKRTMRIVSGEDASAFFEISAVNLELCPIHVVEARFTAAESTQVFTLQGNQRSRAVVCGVAVFSHP